MRGESREEEFTQSGDAYETVTRLIDLWSNGRRNAISNDIPTR